MVIRYGDLLNFVQLMLPLLRLTQQRNLAWTALGILKVRDAAASDAAISLSRKSLGR